MNFSQNIGTLKVYDQRFNATGNYEIHCDGYMTVSISFSGDNGYYLNDVIISSGTGYDMIGAIQHLTMLEALARDTLVNGLEWAYGENTVKVGNKTVEGFRAFLISARDKLIQSNASATDSISAVA